MHKLSYTLPHRRIGIAGWYADFQVLRCGHVFNFEPRGANALKPRRSQQTTGPNRQLLNAELRSSRPGAVKRFSADPARKSHRRPPN